MAFNPAITTERTVVNEDRTWLRTRKGWDTLLSVTLDISSFTETANLDGRVIYSGISLAVLASGLYGPYDTDSGDTQATGTGFLFTSIEIDNDAVASASDVAVAMLWEGIVIEANLRNFGGVEGDVDTGFKNDTTLIRYE